MIGHNRYAEMVIFSLLYALIMLLASLVNIVTVNLYANEVIEKCKNITFEPSVLVYSEDEDHYMEVIGNHALTIYTDEEYHIISNVTDEERELLARIAYCEANSEGIHGMQLVTDVVLNRRKSGKFPNTIKEVLYSPGQFSTIKNIDKVPKKALKNAYKAVDKEINNKRLDYKSLYFARRPLTKNGVYKDGKHYFSR